MTEFLIDESLNQEYETVKARYLAKAHIFAIKECESKLFSLTDEAKLETCGITGCRAVVFFSDTCDRTAPANDRIAGRCIPVQRSTGYFSVILIRSDYPADLPPAFVCASKICVLYHELGHADDFNQGYNFDLRTKQCDQEAAEKYADAFARERLRRIKCQKVVEGKHSPATLWDWYNHVRYLGNYTA